MTENISFGSRRATNTWDGDISSINKQKLQILELRTEKEIEFERKKNFAELVALRSHG